MTLSRVIMRLNIIHLHAMALLPLTPSILINIHIRDAVNIIWYSKNHIVSLSASTSDFLVQTVTANTKLRYGMISTESTNNLKTVCKNLSQFKTYNIPTWKLAILALARVLLLLTIHNFFYNFSFSFWSSLISNNSPLSIFENFGSSFVRNFIIYVQTGNCFLLFSVQLTQSCLFLSSL